MKVLDQLSIFKVGITSNAISESKHKYLRCIMKQTIYKLYTSSKQMKLASYRWISCSNIRRKKRESTANDAISRLYKSSKHESFAPKITNART